MSKVTLALRNEPDLLTRHQARLTSSSRLDSQLSCEGSPHLLASAFDLSHDADLLASELIEAIQSTDCSPECPRYEIASFRDELAGLLCAVVGATPR